MNEYMYYQREILLERMRNIIAKISRYSIALSKDSPKTPEKYIEYLREANRLKREILFCNTSEQLDALSFKIDKYKEIATTLEVIANGI